VIKAMRIIARSKDKTMTGNVGVRFQAKWIERERVKMSVDVRRGWGREIDAEAIRLLTKEDNLSLVGTKEELGEMIVNEWITMVHEKPSLVY
jgi:hypothetical protein